MKGLTLSKVLEMRAVENNDITINDWPYGRSKRCSMHFWIEVKGPGKQRYCKQSTFNGKVNKPKKATYARHVVIVQDKDKKIGRIEFTEYGHVNVIMEDSEIGYSTFWAEEATKIFRKFIDFAKLD